MYFKLLGFSQQMAAQLFYNSFLSAWFSTLLKLENPCLLASVDNRSVLNLTVTGNAVLWAHKVKWRIAVRASNCTKIGNYRQGKCFVNRRKKKKEEFECLMIYWGMCVLCVQGMHSRNPFLAWIIIIPKKKKKGTWDSTMEELGDSGVFSMNSV